MKVLFLLLLSILFLASCTSSSNELYESTNTTEEIQSRTKESQHICPYHDMEMQHAGEGYFCTACSEESEKPGP